MEQGTILDEEEMKEIISEERDGDTDFAIAGWRITHWHCDHPEDENGSCEGDLCVTVEKAYEQNLHYLIDHYAENPRARPCRSWGEVLGAL